MLEVGSKVGRYEVVRLVGEGDLASTWRVEADGEAYALRVLQVPDPGFAERLRRACDAQRQVRHPNLLPVIEAVEVQDLPGVVTPFVHGSDLERWIAGGPHLPSEILALFRQVVAGVAAAHAAGLLHRNLKPGKILIGRDDLGRPQVKIADFLLGKVRQANPIAAVTQMGTTFGTPQYMSPEQFRGAATVDERGDLFALGCILYEMAAGTRAFDGGGLLEIYTAVAKADYPPLEQVRPGLPSWISDVVGGLLRADPADRIPSATALLEKLDAAGASADAPTVDRTDPEPELTEAEVELTDVKGAEDGRALQAAAQARLLRPAAMIAWLAVLGGLGMGIVVAAGLLLLAMLFL